MRQPTLVVGVALLVVATLAIAMVASSPARDRTPGLYGASADPLVAGVRRDVVVYGASASGVLAAIAASREGASVALVEPTSTIGGMVASGLSATDIGRKSTVGGLALEFFERVAASYELVSYGVTVAWRFEPHVAAEVLESMLAETGVEIYRGQRLIRPGGVEVADGRIRAIRTDSGAVFEAAVFIDSTYEGDLLAEAGARFTVGREARSTYGEASAGVGPDVEMRPAISAFSAGAPDTPVQGIGEPPGPIGSGDERIQPYTFRLCVSSDPANRVAFAQPDGYRASRYALLQRVLDKLETRAAGVRLTDVLVLTPLPNRKADVNARNSVATDLLGGSSDYPEASYPRRQEIWRDHFLYESGLLYYLASDPAVPDQVRQDLRAWGLCRDEWPESGHWPPLLYVREARRLVGDFVLTEQDITSSAIWADSIGVASYRIDAHATSLFARDDGLVHVEGSLNVAIPGPYGIPYRILLPRAVDVTNLLVSVAVSASHVAFASLRMEPHYMVMGEAAGIAAAIAAGGGTVQAVDPVLLRNRLVARGAIVDPPPILPTATAAP